MAAALVARRRARVPRRGRPPAPASTASTVTTSSTSSASRAPTRTSGWASPCTARAATSPSTSSRSTAIPVLSIAATLALLAPAVGHRADGPGARRRPAPRRRSPTSCAASPRPGAGAAAPDRRPCSCCSASGSTHRLPRSWFQRIAGRILAAAGIRLVDEYPVRDRRGILLAELDLADPVRKVGVECQSWRWHATPAAQHHDARRRGMLRQLGWEIVDVWWSDLRHPERVDRRARSTSSNSTVLPDRPDRPVLKDRTGLRRRRRRASRRRPTTGRASPASTSSVSASHRSPVHSSRARCSRRRATISRSSSPRRKRRRRSSTPGRRGVVAVGEDRVPQVGRRPRRSRPTVATIGTCHPALAAPPPSPDSSSICCRSRRVSCDAGPVGLVDDEDVGDLHQAGLVGLHAVAPARG